jgi:hypothetical protein
MARWFALCWLGALAGCVIHEDVPPVQTLLDKPSALTVTTMTAPYTFARVGAGGDYLDLRCFEADRMGKHSYFLSLVRFRTGEYRGADEPAAGELTLARVTMAGRSTELVALQSEELASGLSARLFAVRAVAAGRPWTGALCRTDHNRCALRRSVAADVHRVR